MLGNDSVEPQVKAWWGNAHQYENPKTNKDTWAAANNRRDTTPFSTIKGMRKIKNISFNIAQKELRGIYLDLTVWKDNYQW